MLEKDKVFENKKEQNDFIIAIIVIVVFTFFIYMILPRSIKEKVQPTQNFTAKTIDSLNKTEVEIETTKNDDSVINQKSIENKQELDSKQPNKENKSYSKLNNKTTDAKKATFKTEVIKKTSSESKNKKYLPAVNEQTTNKVEKPVIELVEKENQTNTNNNPITSNNKVNIVKNEVKTKIKPNVTEGDCVIVVGVFKEKNNLKNILLSLEKNGYSAVQGFTNNGRMSYAGVPINCNEKSSKRRAVMNNLDKLFKIQSWIIKK